MAHRVLRDEQEEGWESSEFPIVCEVSGLPHFALSAPSRGPSDEEACPFPFGRQPALP